MIDAHLFVWALLVANCWFAQLLWAQNPASPAGGGVKIEYTMLLPNADSGFVPVRVSVSRVPAVPSVSDESFNVSIGANDVWGGSSTQSRFSTELILPAGRTSEEVELLVELRQDFQKLIVERGGKRTNSLRNDVFNELIMLSANAQGIQASKLTWLLVSSEAPKNRTDSRSYYPGQPLFRNRNTYAYANSDLTSFKQSFRGKNEIPGLKKIFQEPLVDVLNRPNWHAIQPTELPETWVGLSSINNVLISNDEFKTLAQAPGYRKLIEQWVAAGGCLIVFNAEDSLSHASSVFPLLLGAERSVQPRLWTTSYLKPNSAFPSSVTKKYSSKLAGELIAKDRVAFSPYLNGEVAVMARPETLPLSIQNLHFGNSSERPFGITRLSGDGRVSPIPGVGKPPIALFGVIAGFFLFLIGPVILVFVTLNNSRRFLFFLVPVFSFLACTGILGYAVVVDFNKQLGRTDTITEIDSQASFAYSEAYSAYYCGSQPAYYAYDQDVFVRTTVENGGGYRIRKLPDENRLSSPRIKPRKNHEVFTSKPYLTKQRFLVSSSPEASSPPTVTNLLGGRIDRAFFTYNDKSYLVRDLDPKQTSLGIELPIEDCFDELRQAVVGRQFHSDSALFRGANSQVRRIINAQAGLLGQQKRIARVRTSQNFVAVLSDNPAIAPLIEPFDYKLQLHIVHGKY